MNSTRLHTQVELQKWRWRHIFEHHYLDPRVFVLNLRNVEEHELSAKHKENRTSVVSSSTSTTWSDFLELSLGLRGRRN